MKNVLAARQDNNGDVILCGPALRALARQARVTLLCGPRGESAARLLPSVDEVLVREAEWIDAQPRAVVADSMEAFVAQLRERAFEEAVIFTSFHQSALPLALLLRMAGIQRIGAISDDYPGSLLDVRHRVDDDGHEVLRALSLVRVMGYDLDSSDDAALELRCADPPFDLRRPYVVVHPGCTMPARAWFPERNAALVETLALEGWNVVVTGDASERDLCAFVAGAHAINLCGLTTFAQYAGVVRDAQAVICGNTAAAHVAAAVRTPVVSIFPPTIPAVRFVPWKVPYVLLGDQNVACSGCRARVCPVPGQPCLAGVTVDDVMTALRALTGREACAA